MRPSTTRHRALLRLLLPGLLTASGVGVGVGQEPPTGQREMFVDRAAETGLDFVHFNGMSGEFYYPEMTGGGAALLDYDGDGDLDVYLVQGKMLGRGKTVDDALFPPRHPLPLTDRLYRNELVSPDGGGELRFTDVTAEAGLTRSEYGIGVTTGDFDNDGRIDIYVTNYGSNQLLRNRGDGTFEDVTAAAEVDDTRWSVAASFFDYDRDGWLDLFVANYVDFTEAVHKVCTRASGARDYCGPLAYAPEPDRLFRNRGDGTFEEVTARAGLGTVYGAALGASTADFDDDGWPDIYVANDMTPNQLWINQGDGTFVDDSLLAGSGVNREGKPEASMGVATEDFDGDGDVDIFLTHLLGETNTLYVNDGGGFFQDRTLEHGLATPSWNYTGFGTGWFDIDNDGWLDLLVLNGEVKALEELVERRDPYPLHQPNQIYRNQGDGTYEEITARAGSVFELSEVSRGAAFGDLDNDGDTDVVVVNNAGPVRLLINQVGQDAAWIGFRLLGSPTAAAETAGDGRRDMLGARLALHREGAPTLHRRVRTDSSYAAANDPRVLFGLGEGRDLTRLEVVWPDGGRESFDDFEIGAYNVLVQGTGTPSPDSG